MNNHPIEVGNSSAAAKKLNEVAGPLGYNVLWLASTPEHEQTTTRFELRQLGSSEFFSMTFPDAESAGSYLERLKAAPQWELDLTDSSIVVKDETVTDTDSGVTFDLRGSHWQKLKLGRVRAADAGPGTPILQSLRIRSEDAPKIGKWTKVPPTE